MTAVPVTFSIRAINMSPGSHVLIEAVPWQQYEALLTELGDDRRIPRINYAHQTLELMSPLPIHERPHRLMAAIVTALLDLQDRDWEDFGATTFRKAPEAGLEPDTCFYIQNAYRMLDCDRFDPDRDPPPDLAIESDVTSRTTLEAYRLLGVPEVWIYADDVLTIKVLQDGNYQTSDISPTFPDLALREMIPQLMQAARRSGTRQMLRLLRQQYQNSSKSDRTQ
jgi:Uma2 family endonuclease